MCKVVNALTLKNTNSASECYQIGNCHSLLFGSYSFLINHKSSSAFASVCTAPISYIDRGDIFANGGGEPRSQYLSEMDPGRGSGGGGASDRK